MRRTLSSGARGIRRVIVAFVGASVLLAGLVLLVTPGPAIIVIPVGLGILATEFAWATRLLRSVGDRIRSIAARATDGSRRAPAR